MAVIVEGLLSVSDGPAKSAPVSERSLQTAHRILGSVGGAVLEAQREHLADFRGALIITDKSGHILVRTVVDAVIEDYSDALGIVPGCCIWERAAGMSAIGIALETGRGAIVKSMHHLGEDAADLASVAAPIRQPTTRRLIGSVALVCEARDVNRLQLAWVSELSARIEEGLLDGASSRTRTLFAAYLKSGQSARHPVVCLNESTVVSNAAAARLLDAKDHALLWELAARQVNSPRPGSSRVALSTGHLVDIAIHPIIPGAAEMGVRLSLTRVLPEAPRKSAAARSPHGSVPASAAIPVFPSVRWRQFLHDLDNAWSQHQHVLIVGEPGNAKTSLALALAQYGHSCPVPQVFPASQVDFVATALEAALDEDPPSVVLRRADLLSVDELNRILKVLRSPRCRRTRVIATVNEHMNGEESSRLLNWPGGKVVAPSLRERPEDLPILVSAMTKRVCSGRSVPMWSGEAIQLLSRISWPANLESLFGAVSIVSREVTGPVVRVKDLPSHLVARASRRQLTRFEQVEAQAIAEAMRASGGNKLEAASSLGIARSTLYRKLRAFGVDLNGETY